MLGWQVYGVLFNALNKAPTSSEHRCRGRVEQIGGV